MPARVSALAVKPAAAVASHGPLQCEPQLHQIIAGCDPPGLPSRSMACVLSRVCCKLRSVLRVDCASSAAAFQLLGLQTNPTVALRAAFNGRMYEIEFAAQGNIFDVVLAGGQIYEIEFVAHLPTRHEFGISCLGLLENCNRGLECSVVLSHFFKLTLNVYWHSFEVSIAWRQRSLKAGLVEQSLKQGCELRCGKLQLYFRGGRFPNFSRHPWGGFV